MLCNTLLIHAYILSLQYYIIIPQSVLMQCFTVYSLHCNSTTFMYSAYVAIICFFSPEGEDLSLLLSSKAKAKIFSMSITSPNIQGGHMLYIL